MKKKLILAIIFLCVAGAVIYAKNKAQSILGLEFIDVETAAKKWGEASFTPMAFKKAGEKKRATMIADLIRSKKYIGKPFSEVRQDLGEWDGYFQTDSIPAYSIESARTGSKEAWLVVFFPDASGRKVGEIKINKECCFGE